jgi:calcineurin-like phosphoesterase family protein
MRLSLPVVFTCALTAAACGGGANPGGPTDPPPPPPTGGSRVLVGAGDIGMCGSPGPAATARLIDGIDGAVFTAGDNAYPNGSARDFAACYDPTWGRHRDRTYPTPGNHDYETPGASAYFDYFGEIAGAPGLGFYSFDLGSWHVLALNSNIRVEPGSPQYAFVTRDLALHPTPCTLAIWHHPVFSSGPNGNNRYMADIYRALYDANADIVINGHDHWYERFGPQDADGRPDTARGIRQFVVGTGGAEQTGLARQQPNSEFQLRAFGVLKLTLNPGSYEWSFVQTSGAVVDFATGRCH